jgi:hypothetical protein
MLEERLDVNWGAPESPLPLEAVEKKFRDNARGILSAAAVEGMLDAVASLERVGSRILSSLMAPAEIHRKTA